MLRTCVTFNVLSRIFCAHRLIFIHFLFVLMNDDQAQQQITRRMAIADGTCVSFCNQLRHILASPGYTPGTIAVNVTWMESRLVNEAKEG